MFIMSAVPLDKNDHIGLWKLQVLKYSFEIYLSKHQLHAWHLSSIIGNSLGYRPNLLVSFIGTKSCKQYIGKHILWFSDIFWLLFWIFDAWLLFNWQSSTLSNFFRVNRANWWSPRSGMVFTPLVSLQVYTFVHASLDVCSSWH